MYCCQSGQIGWASLWERQGQDIGEFPHLAAWIERVTARPAVKTGLNIGIEKIPISNRLATISKKRLSIALMEPF